MLKRIGLITFYKDNFGSILQCYATKNVLESAGFECDVIYEEIEGKAYFLKKVKGLARLIWSCIFDYEYVENRKRLINTPQPLSHITWKMMDEFVDKEFSPHGYSFTQLCKIEKGYGAFIVGSDQVWNAFNDIPRSQFLKFTTDDKKIAFAVSFGTDNITDKFLKIVKSGLKGFPKVSVREESGIEIVKRVSDVPVQRIADPTLMLNAGEWRDFCKGVKQEMNYILVHFLNCPSGTAIRAIEGQRERSGLRVVCIGYKYDVFNEHGWEYYDCNPREYVAYIDNADHVYTDSFHTTLFSINLGSDFYTFERQYLHRHPQSSRIDDLLKRYNLEDRFIKGKGCMVVSNVEEVSELIEREQEITIEYLRKEIDRIDESL